MVNEYYQQALGTSDRNFVNFVKITNQDLTDDALDDLEFVVKRVAQNMLLYPENINTAKPDYVLLVAMLIKKGVIYEKYKDILPDPENYE